MAELPTGTVTFLFTDVEGSTRMWDEDAPAMRLLRRLADEGPAGRADRSAGRRPEPPPEPLTDREVEVVRLMAEGRTNPQIAASIFVSVGTVKAHVQHIIAKLEVSDRTQASVRAAELGLLSAEPG